MDFKISMVNMPLATMQRASIISPFIQKIIHHSLKATIIKQSSSALMVSTVSKSTLLQARLRLQKKTANSILSSLATSTFMMAYPIQRKTRQKKQLSL